MEHADLPELEPAPGTGPAGFTVLPAAQGGQIPQEVADELSEVADALRPHLPPGDDGTIGVRFGRRVVVAPINALGDAVDIADVDIPRNMILTMGGEAPTASGALLAQLFMVRDDVVTGYARTPDTGPSVSVLQELLPALRGVGACRVDDVGVVALGRRPAEIAGALAGLEDDDEAKTNEA